MKFTFKDYISVIEKVMQNRALDEKEKLFLLRQRVVQLIASIPFVAEVEDPVDVSAKAIELYLDSLKGQYTHNESGVKTGNPYYRYEPFLNLCKTAKKPELLKVGVARIALIDLEDQKRDKAKDVKIGKYNPIANKDWDYSKQKKLYTKEAEKETVEEYDAIMEVKAAGAVFWM